MNYQSKDDLGGQCAAAEGKRVEAERDVSDCIARAFEPKDKKEDTI